MKILILVLSYQESPYLELMRAQQETFDRYEDDIKVVYYYGEGNGWVTDREFASPLTNEYYSMAGKFRDALIAVDKWDYDIIFRTNSSSYANKPALTKFCEGLPTSNLYAGWEIPGDPAAGFNVVSGAGIFLSHDVCEKLINDIDPLFRREEDCVIAEKLAKYPEIKIIDDKSRYDVPPVVPHEIPLDRYHYRFKTGDRFQDAENMRLLHQKIINQ